MTVFRPGVFAHTQKQWRRKSFIIVKNWNKNLNRLFKESFSLHGLYLQLCLFFYTLTIKRNKMNNWKLTNDESLYFCWSLYNLSFIWFIIKAISPTSIRKSAVILVHSVHIMYFISYIMCIFQELDPVTLHNQALLNMDTKPSEGFEKLAFLLQQPSFPPVTFGNLLLLYCKHEVRSSILSEGDQLQQQRLTLTC